MIKTTSNDDEPFFIDVLKNRKRYSKFFKKKGDLGALDMIDFISSAQKCVVDVDEYWDFIEENGRDFKELYAPFDRFYIEFRDIKRWRKSCLNVEAGSGIHAIGFDIPRNWIWIILIDHANGLTFTKSPLDKLLSQAVDEDEDFILGCITNYLQTEYVNATTKSVRTGSRWRRGKLIQHVSPYMVVCRKQPHQKTETPENLQKATVDWQHRWHVKGHWRKIKGTGKDFDGNDIEGWTWVKACIKGPEDKPIVEKTRIVRDTLPRHYQEIRAHG